MPPTLSWLDSSSASRRQAMEVLKLFQEQGTVDEIGIGTVRDALSDALFPGTSVLHTRARYFLFIPWIYLHLERRETPSNAVAKDARRIEIGLIHTLLASDDSANTIGRIAQERLKQLPSAMYWNGLQVWGLKHIDLSQDQYHRSLDRQYRRRNEIERDDDGQPLDLARRRNWHSGLPKAPDRFPKCPLSFRLTRTEAEYLRERLLTQCPGTLLTHLVDQCSPVADDIPFVWSHPERGDFPELIQRRLVHAQNFSEAIYGAALLYNLMLAEAADRATPGRLPDTADEHGAEFARWANQLVQDSARFAHWDRGEFWQLVTLINPRISPATKRFIDSWLDLALSGRPAALRDSASARQLLADRERSIKGRLAPLHNLKALNAWRGSSGAFQLTYRWDPQVRRVTTDIQQGLRTDA